MIILKNSYNQAILPAKLSLNLGEYVSVHLTDNPDPRSTPWYAIESTPVHAHSFSKSFATAISTALALIGLHFRLSFCLLLGLGLVRHDFIG